VFKLGPQAAADLVVRMGSYPGVFGNAFTTGGRSPRSWGDARPATGSTSYSATRRCSRWVTWRGAAAGKDSGFSHLHLVEECARTRYVQSEIDSLDFDGPVPRAAEISSRWQASEIHTIY
jgi:hypothetical protein